MQRKRTRLSLVGWKLSSYAWHKFKIIHDTQCTRRENNNMNMLDHEVKQTAKQCNQIQNGQETDNMNNSHSCQSLATSSVMTEKISTFNRCCKLAISYEVCVRLIDDTTSSAIERISTFKVTRPSFLGGLPSYFEAPWYPHLYFYRKSNT